VTLKEWVQKHDRQIAAHDKQIAAIRALVQEGMRLVITSRKDIRELHAAQKRTDASLKALIDQMRRSGGDGHGKGKVDVQ
jgi:hypothetical protein